METSSKQIREIERGEAWLARIVDAAPSAHAVSRAKLAVRRELAVKAKAPSRLRRSAPFGAWAAAAMLLLSAGVISRAVRDYSPASPPAMAKVDKPAWVLDQDDAALTALDVEIDNLNQGPQYAMDGGLEALTQAVEEMETEIARPWAS